MPSLINLSLHYGINCPKITPSIAGPHIAVVISTFNLFNHLAPRIVSTDYGIVPDRTEHMSSPVVHTSTLSAVRMLACDTRAFNILAEAPTFRFTQAISVGFTSCRGVPFQEAISKIDRLQYLRINEFRGVVDSSVMVSGLQFLKTLILDSVSLSTSNLDLILNNSPDLDFIIVSFCGTDVEETIKNLVVFGENHQLSTRLRYLNVFGMRLSFDSSELKRMFTNCPNLQGLSLPFADTVTSEDLLADDESAMSLGNLRYLQSLDLSTAVTRVPVTSAIATKTSQIDDQVLKLIGSELPYIRCVRLSALRRVNFSAEGLSHLFDSRATTSVEKFQVLGGGEMDDEGLAMICNKHNPCLRSLSLPRNASFTSNGLKHLPHLRTVLRELSLSAAVSVDDFSVLKELTLLEMLELCHNHNLTSDQLSQIVYGDTDYKTNDSTTGCWRNLKSLNVSFCKELTFSPVVKRILEESTCNDGSRDVAELLRLTKFNAIGILVRDDDAQKLFTRLKRNIHCDLSVTIVDDI